MSFRLEPHNSPATGATIEAMPRSISQVESKENDKPVAEASDMQTFHGGDSIESLVKIGLDPRVAEALQDMGITMVTAVQKAVFTNYLEAVRDDQGLPRIPGYHIASGFATGKTLAHAITVVDYLTKYPGLVAAGPSIINLDEHDVNTERATHHIYRTGSVHAMIVCPTRSHAGRTYEIYEKSCHSVNITVRLLHAHDGQSLLRHDRGDINQIMKSQATIVIGTIGQLLQIAKTNIHDRCFSRPTETNEGKAVIQDNTTKPKASCLFHSTKVVVMDDSFGFCNEKWKKHFEDFKKILLPLVDVSCAYIVVPRRNSDDYVSFLSLRHTGESSWASCYLIKDVKETSHHNAISWEVVPHFLVSDFNKQDSAHPSGASSYKILEKLQLRKGALSKFTTVLVGGSRTYIEDLYERQACFDKDFKRDAALIHSFIDPKTVDRILKEFEGGKKTILFITADLITMIDLRVNQVLVSASALRKDSQVNDILIAITSAHQVGHVGAAYMYFQYWHSSDIYAFEYTHQRLREISPASVNSSFFKYAAKQLRAAVTDANDVMYAYEEATEDLDIQEKGINIRGSYYALLSVEKSKPVEVEGNQITDFRNSATLEIQRYIKEEETLDQQTSYDRTDEV